MNITQANNAIVTLTQFYTTSLQEKEQEVKAAEAAAKMAMAQVTELTNLIKAGRAENEKLKSALDEFRATVREQNVQLEEDAKELNSLHAEVSKQAKALQDLQDPDEKAREALPF